MLLARAAKACIPRASTFKSKPISHRSVRCERDPKSVEIEKRSLLLGGSLTDLGRRQVGSGGYGRRWKRTDLPARSFGEGSGRGLGYHSRSFEAAQPASASLTSSTVISVMDF